MSSKKIGQFGMINTIYAPILAINTIYDDHFFLIKIQIEWKTTKKRKWQQQKEN